jgi:hypothetical protein
MDLLQPLDLRLGTQSNIRAVSGSRTERDHSTWSLTAWPPNSLRLLRYLSACARSMGGLG